MLIGLAMSLSWSSLCLAIDSKESASFQPSAPSESRAEADNNAEPTPQLPNSTHQSADSQPRAVGMCGPLAQSINAPAPLILPATPALTGCEELSLRMTTGEFQTPDPAENDAEKLQPSFGISTGPTPAVAEPRVYVVVQRDPETHFEQSHYLRLWRPPLA